MSYLKVNNKLRKKINIFLMFLSVFLLISFLIIGCEPKYVEINKQWREEILLSNGETIWVKRTAAYKVRAESTVELSTYADIGTMNLDLTIEFPNTDIAPAPPIWNFDAEPLLLDYDADKKTWFIVATRTFCSSWKKAGKPAMIPWQYEVQAGKWVVVPLNNKLIGHEFNMFTYFTAKYFESDTVSIADVEEGKRWLSVSKIIERKTDCYDR